MAPTWMLATLPWCVAVGRPCPWVGEPAWRREAGRGRRGGGPVRSGRATSWCRRLCWRWPLLQGLPGQGSFPPTLFEVRLSIFLTARLATTTSNAARCATTGNSVKTGSWHAAGHATVSPNYSTGFAATSLSTLSARTEARPAPNGHEPTPVLRTAALMAAAPAPLWPRQQQARPDQFRNLGAKVPATWASSAAGPASRPASPGTKVLISDVINY